MMQNSLRKRCESPPLCCSPFLGPDVVSLFTDSVPSSEDSAAVGLLLGMEMLHLAVTPRGVIRAAQGQSTQLGVESISASITMTTELINLATLE